MDKVRSHPVNPLPRSVGGGVWPWSRRQGGSGQCPADLVGRPCWAVAEGEEDGVKVTGRLAGEEVVEERLIKLSRGRGAREVQEVGRWTTNCELLRCP